MWWPRRFQRWCLRRRSLDFAPRAGDTMASVRKALAMAAFSGRVGRVVLGRTRLLVRGGAQGVRGREGRRPVMEGPATSRRTFLKASAACGIGALGAGFLAGCGGGGQQADSGGTTGAAMLEDIAWDGAFDVVVVGLGAAGTSAAIAAAESGASVLVVDKAPEGSEGGNSRCGRCCVCHQRERGTCLRRGACGRLLRARRRAGRLRTGLSGRP